MDEDKLAKQVEFLKLGDLLKFVQRLNTIENSNGERRKETSGEHSWHVVLSALILAEHTAESVDLLRVVKMLAIHDLVEVKCGDVFHYEKNAGTNKKEQAAAKEIFAMLPEEQAAEYLELWEEFEERSTAESRYAASIDRMWPVIHNCRDNGGTWREKGVAFETVLSRNLHVKEGSKVLWEYLHGLITELAGRG
jgi:putative hydrolases of HD superfamily